MAISKDVLAILDELIRNYKKNGLGSYLNWTSADKDYKTILGSLQTLQLLIQQQEYLTDFTVITYLNHSYFKNWKANPIFADSVRDYLYKYFSQQSSIQVHHTANPYFSFHCLPQEEGQKVEVLDELIKKEEEFNKKVKFNYERQINNLTEELSMAVIENDNLKKNNKRLEKELMELKSKNKEIAKASHILSALEKMIKEGQDLVLTSSEFSSVPPPPPFIEKKIEKNTISSVSLFRDNQESVLPHSTPKPKKSPSQPMTQTQPRLNFLEQLKEMIEEKTKHLKEKTPEITPKEDKGWETTRTQYNHNWINQAVIKRFHRVEKEQGIDNSENKDSSFPPSNQSF